MRPVAIFATTALIGGLLHAIARTAGWATADHHLPNWLVFITWAITACTIAGSGMIILATSLLFRAGKTLCSWQPRPAPIAMIAGLLYPWMIVGAARVGAPSIAACFNLPARDAATLAAGLALLLLPAVMAPAVMHASPTSRRYTLRPTTHRQFDRN